VKMARTVLRGRDGGNAVLLPDQDAVNYFKEWLPNVNRLYELTVRQIKKEREAADRLQLQREVEQKERMLRLRQSIKI
jgi:hypothetical protein